jgi:hypothetical protein
VNDKKVRGACIIAFAQYIDERLPPAQREAVMRLVPSEILATRSQLKGNEFYPIEYFNAYMRAIVTTVDDSEQAYKLAIEAGRYIANDAINTFLRLLVKFLSPALFARKFGDFFRKDHNFGSVETDLSDIDKKRYVLIMSGVEGYEHIGASAMGWMIHTLTAMGCKNINVKETLSPPPGPQNVDKYRFEVTWS